MFETVLFTVSTLANIVGAAFSWLFSGLASSTMHSISYSPLDASKDEIRLLTVQPRTKKPMHSESKVIAVGEDTESSQQQADTTVQEVKENSNNGGNCDDDDEDEIICTLQTISLTPEPVYTALSYMWGDPAMCESINVNGNKVSVTANLKAALKALRKDGEALVLWVDAICINQADNAEKSVQVGMMQRIYAHASSVLVWLGPAADGSDTVMSTFETIGGSALAAGIMDLNGDDYTKLRHSRETGAPLLNPWLEERRDALDALSDEIGSGMPNTELDSFGCRAYWYRVWIMQEFVVAKEVKLVCGTMSLCYECFAAAALFQSWHRVRRDLAHMDKRAQEDGGPSQRISEPDIQFGMIMTLVGARRRWLGQMKKPRDTLVELLIRTCLGHQYPSKQRASEIKDIVYGLLSMARDREELGINIDYHKSVEEIYTDTARALLYRGHMNILPWNQPANMKAVPNLPSWVPDFSTPISDVCGEHRHYKVFSAGGGGTGLLPNTYPPFSSPSLGLAPLTLICYPVALIDGVLSPWTTDNVFDGMSTGPYFRAIEIALSLRLEPPAGSPLSKQTPERRAEAIWRIPTGDLSYNGNRVRATSELHATYQEVREVMGDTPPVDGATALALVERVKEMSPAAFMYCINLGYHVKRKVFISGDAYYVGLVPESAKEGDVVAVPKGASLPYVFRLDKARNGWVLVGEAYVDGIMDGEILEAGTVEPVEFTVY